MLELGSASDEMTEAEPKGVGVFNGEYLIGDKKCREKATSILASD